MEQISEHYVEVLGYAVLIEEGQRNCSAFIPDLPGCYGLASTVEEIVEQMKVGIPFHIEGLQLDGDPVPPPVMTVETLAARERAASGAVRPASAGRAAGSA